jgi:hypothetical protein
MDPSQVIGGVQARCKHSQLHKLVAAAQTKGFAAEAVSEVSLLSVRQLSGHSCDRRR